MIAVQSRCAQNILQNLTLAVTDGACATLSAEALTALERATFASIKRPLPSMKPSMSSLACMIGVSKPASTIKGRLISCSVAIRSDSRQVMKSIRRSSAPQSRTAWAWRSNTLAVCVHQSSLPALVKDP